MWLMTKNIESMRILKVTFPHPSNSPTDNGPSFSYSSEVVRQSLLASKTF